MTAGDNAIIAKRAAAEAAMGEVMPGMLVGLGTGSTAAFAIAALADRVRGGLAIRTVATSIATADAARAAGLVVLDFATVDRLDLTIDGVDEVDDACRAIKGAGGALLREKIVATASRRMVAIADASKAVAMLGRGPVPVEVLPFAQGWVMRALRDLGGAPVLRLAGDVPAASDQGNRLIDTRFGTIADPAALAAALAAVPGILGHGLFVEEIDSVYIADGRDVRHYKRVN